MSTFGVFCRRLRVLKFGTVQSVPISRRRLDEAGRLAQRHAEQHLHGQARLDSSIAIDRLSSPFTGRRGFPGHRWIEPDRQRAA
jgi:hypothetical protein